jgi:competence protein ComEC
MGDVAGGPSIAFRGRQTGLKSSAYSACSAASARLEAWLEAEPEQLPLWLPVGLVAGVAAWFWLPSRATWCGFLLAMASIALAGLVFGRIG